MYQEVQPLADGPADRRTCMAEVTEGLALTRLGAGSGRRGAAAPAKSVAPEASKRPAPRRAARARRGADRARARRRDRRRSSCSTWRGASSRPRTTATRWRWRRSCALARCSTAHQPRKAMTELERAAKLCDAARLPTLPAAVRRRAREMVEYALVRHVAEALLRGSGATMQAAATAPPSASAGSVPASDMLPAVRAFAFGRGSVLVGERQVSDLEWRSEKSKEMFFFLLVAQGVGRPRRRSSPRSGRTCRSRSATATSTRASTACAARSSTSASCGTPTAATCSTRRASFAVGRRRVQRGHARS